MDGGGKKAPAPAAASTFGGGDGELPGRGLESVGQAGVDLGGPGSKGLGAEDLSASDRAVDCPEPVCAGVDYDLTDSECSAHALATRSLLSTDADDAGPAAPAFAQAGRGAERDPVRDMAVDHLPPAGDDLMRPAALLAMQVGAMTLIGELDAPWPNQFGAMLFWLAGCIALFLSRH